MAQADAVSTTPSRRSILNGVLAITGGAKIAATAMSERDPVVELGAELKRLDAIARCDDDAVADAAATQMVVIEDQIVERVPTSVAGALVQMKMLRSYLDTFETCAYSDAMMDNIATCLARLSQNS